MRQGIIGAKNRGERGNERRESWDAADVKKRRAAFRLRPHTPNHCRSKWNPLPLRRDVAVSLTSGELGRGVHRLITSINVGMGLWVVHPIFRMKSAMESLLLRFPTCLDPASSSWTDSLAEASNHPVFSSSFTGFRCLFSHFYSPSKQQPLTLHLAHDLFVSSLHLLDILLPL